MESVRTEFALGWGVLIASAAGFGLGLSGLPFYTTALFVEPLSAAFHWSLAEIQGGLTIMLLSNVVTLPVAGWLATRFGGRRVGLVSVVLFSLSFMSLAGLNRSLIAYYVHWIALSVGGAGTLAVIWGPVISTWFAKGRGTALGIAMMGTGITAAFAPILCNTLISILGWRGAYLGLGALPLVIALPLVWAFFRRKAGKDEALVTNVSQGSGAVMANWRFWVIGIAFLLVGAAVAGMIPNSVMLLRSHGWSKTDAAGVASLLGLFVIVGRAGCGVLMDRVWAPVVAAGFFGFAAIGCVLLQTPHLAPPLLSVSAVAVGLAAGAEFDVLPYLASRYFGVERGGFVLGLLSMFFYAGAAIGPLGMGRLADITGSFAFPLVMAALCFGVGGSLFLTLGRYPAHAR